MAEETWHAARLIPTSGINGADEQERRATSALLAVMGAVKEFGRALTTPLGAPAGVIETFTEVPFDIGDRRVFVDGLIRARRGQKNWTALVEVKTGSSTLGREQLECYLDVAREQGFDAMVTISNEIASTPGSHPTAVDKRKTKRVALHHFSWTQILTEAVVQKVHRGVGDPEQAWILGELIRYLEHPRSGAMEFEDMGPSWVAVREAVAAGTLRPGDKGLAEVAGRWDQLIRFAALRMGRQLGIEVQPALSRRELAEPVLRTQAVADGLVRRGVLEGGLKIPNAVGPVEVTVDVRAGKVTISVDVDAPREGRATTRVNWLVRQLKDAPETVRIDCFALHSRTGTSALLKEVRLKPEVLVEDPKREIKSFAVAITVPMGAKRAQGRGSFVASVLDGIDVFYGTVVQNLKPWAAAPPKLRTEAAQISEPGVPEALVSTAVSSQDEPEPADEPTEAALDERSDAPAPDPVADDPGATSTHEPDAADWFRWPNTPASSL